MDDCEDLVPEWLRFMKGIVDSNDIPLNVSRSYLQNDPYVRKITSHIIKKVADKYLQEFNHAIEGTK